MLNALKILIWTPERQRPFGRPNRDVQRKIILKRNMHVDLYGAVPCSCAHGNEPLGWIRVRHWTTASCATASFSRTVLHWVSELLSVFLCICPSVYLPIDLYLASCLSVCLHFRVCIYIHVCQFMYISISMCIYVYIYQVDISMYIYLPEYIYIHVC
jgi:hypothetical protein